MDEEDRTTEVRETSTPTDRTEVTKRSVVTRADVSVGVVAQRIVYLIFGIIVTFLLLRMALLLLGANQGNAVVDFIYGVSAVFVAPFYGIFNYTPVYGATVLDITSVVAVIIYLLIAWGLASIVTLSSRKRDL
jgi:YGGT family